MGGDGSSRCSDTGTGACKAKERGLWGVRGEAVGGGGPGDGGPGGGGASGDSGVGDGVGDRGDKEEICVSESLESECEEETFEFGGGSGGSDELDFDDG